MKLKFTIPYIIGAMGVAGMATSPLAGAEADDRPANDSINKYLAYVGHIKIPDIMYNIAPDTLIRATRAIPRNKDVLYIYENGDTIIRHRGTRAWRNNNPGNLRHGKFTRANGAIGECGGFAVFPDAETGMDALCNLLMSDSYKNLTMAAAIRKYAPPSQNNVALYLNKLKKLTGLPTTTKLHTLSPEQLIYVAESIRTIEGWREGVEATTTAQRDTLANVSPQTGLENTQKIRNSLIMQNNVHSR